MLGRKNWKKRWFVLYPNVIKYYSNPVAAQQRPGDALGEVYLVEGNSKPVTLEIEDRDVGKARGSTHNRDGRVPHILIRTHLGRIFEIRASDAKSHDAWESKIKDVLEAMEA